MAELPVRESLQMPPLRAFRCEGPLAKINSVRDYLNLPRSRRYKIEYNNVIITCQPPSLSLPPYRVRRSNASFIFSMNQTCLQITGSKGYASIGQLSRPYCCLELFARLGKRSPFISRLEESNL